jgi:type IV pilus assembly protein PilW
MNTSLTPFASARRARGLSLVELMVALTLGTILLGGAVYMYQQGRGTFVVNERQAEVQNAGRYVLALIEPDIELAGFYGYTSLAESVRFVSGGDTGNVTAYGSAMRQEQLLPTDPVPTPLANLGPAAHDCGRNYALDVSRPIQGTDNAYLLGTGADAAACGPIGAAMALADTLTVRRVATQPAAAAVAGRLQIYAPRLRSRTAHFMFADGTAPGVVNADNQLFDFVVRRYYISQDSVGRPGYPSLRVKTLTNNAGGPFFRDEELMPGIEDLQVQFGIDTGDYNGDGNIDPGFDVNDDTIPESNGRATRYVDSNFPGLDRFQIVAVRVWIRARADQPEVGYTDNKEYVYANRRFQPNATERGYRRVLMSRTITLRNARTL